MKKILNARIIWLGAFFCFYLSLILLNDGNEQFDSENLDSSQLIVNFMSAVIFSGLASYVSTTVVGLLGLRTETSSYQDERYIQNITTQLNELKNEVGRKQTGIQLTQKQQLELFDSAKETILKGLEPEMLEIVYAEALREQYGTTFKASLSRLSQQIEVLGSRANLNLVVGISFNLVGLVALWSTFFSDEIPASVMESGVAQQWLQVSFYYLPRLSLALIVEFIGFFFLRLYLRTLVDIRYSQNELTNVELKLLALTVALQREDKRSIATILDELGGTERNAVIGKNQTSLEIEKERAQSDVYRRIFETLPQFLKDTRK